MNDDFDSNSIGAILSPMFSATLDLPCCDDNFSVVKELADQLVDFLPNLKTIKDGQRRLFEFKNSTRCSEIPHLPVVEKRLGLLMEWFTWNAEGDLKEALKPAEKAKQPKRAKQVPIYVIRSAPKSSKGKARKIRNNNSKSSISRRVTVAQAFKSVLATQVDAQGRYYFSIYDAEWVALQVFALQVKISNAGCPSQGLTPKRSAYTKLRDALAHAHWKREIKDGYIYYSL